MKVDGWITIGTRIVKNDLRKGLKWIEKQLESSSSKLTKVFTSSGKGIKSFLAILTKVATTLVSVVGSIIVIGALVGALVAGAIILAGAFKKVFEENEQVKADLNYIVFAIKQALEPAVNAVADVLVKIVNIIVRIIQYTAILIQAWTGRNIFESATIEAFEESMKKAEKSSGKTAKNAKEINKQLAGFDEMNILSDKSSSGASSGGGGGFVAPSFDLSNLDDVPIPKALKWIIDNKDLMLEALAGITTAFIAMKLLGLDPIMALGIGIAVMGLIRMIKSIIKFIKDPAFKNFIGILEGIALGVTGVAIAFSAWPIAIAGALALAVIEVVKHYDEIKGWFDKLKNYLGGEWSNAMINLFGPVGAGIAGIFNYWIGYVYGMFEGFYGGLRTLVEGIVALFRGDFKTGITLAFDGILSIITTPFNAMRQGINGVIDVLNALIKKINELTGLNIGQVGKIPDIFNRLGEAQRTAQIGGQIGKANSYSTSSYSFFNGTSIDPMFSRATSQPITNVIQIDGTTIAKQFNNINYDNDFLRNR